VDEDYSTNWSAVASSADGTKLVAVVNGGGIHISPDAGVTWTAADAPNRNWSAVASSADGNKLVAVVGGTVAFLSGGGPPGPIYRSTDSGVTWTERTPSFAYVVSVAASADGTRIAASTYDPFHSGGSSQFMSQPIPEPRGTPPRRAEAGGATLPPRRMGLVWRRRVGLARSGTAALF
jgi:hypothetical protein